MKTKTKSNGTYGLASKNIIDEKSCYIDLAKKITENKYKIKIDSWEEFDDMFKTINNSINYFCCDGNIIFIGIANGTRRSSINKKLDGYGKVDYFYLDGKNIDSPKLVISDSNLLKIMREINSIY